MHASATWHGGHRTVLNDGRGHEVVVDLPAHEGGEDLGTSSLELNVLSLAGCITTIFALVAQRRHLRVESMQLELEAERPRGAPTISSVHGSLRVRTAAPADEVEATLGITLRTCPVGILFEKAHIPVEVQVVVERVPP
jgi:putative redox protein